jgi:hypothetical protein
MLQYSSDFSSHAFQFHYLVYAELHDLRPSTLRASHGRSEHRARINQATLLLNKTGSITLGHRTSLLLTYNEYFPDGQLGSSQRSQALMLEPAPTYYLSVLSAPVIAQLGCRQRSSLCLIAKSDLWVHLVCRAQVGWVLVLGLGRASSPWAPR